jgi:hypothetical protein
MCIYFARQGVTFAITGSRSEQMHDPGRWLPHSNCPNRTLGTCRRVGR